MSDRNMLTVFLILLAFPLVSQTWFPQGARWEVNQASFFPPGNFPFFNEIVEKDSINGFSMGRMQGGCACSDWNAYYYLYADNDRVFAYNPSTDDTRLLYDFTLEVGDTLTYEHPEDGPSHFRLDSVTLVDFQGTPIRVQHFTQLSGWYYIGPRIYEYIGSWVCLYPQVGYCDPGSGSVICYEDPDHGFFNLSPACRLSSLPELNPYPAATAFPNPTMDELHLEAEQPMVRMQLFEITTGRSHLHPLHGQSRASLSVDGYPRGLYLLEVVLSDGTRARQRILFL